MTDNPTYGSKIYNVLSRNVSNDKFSLSEEEFIAKMENDSTYRDKIYGVLSSNIPKEKFSLSPEEFGGKFLKKKDLSQEPYGTAASISSLDVPSSEQPKIEAVEEQAKEILNAPKEEQSSWLDFFNVGKALGAEDVIPSFGGMVAASQAEEAIDKGVAQTQMIRSIESGLLTGELGTMTYEELLGDLDPEDYKRISEINQKLLDQESIESLEFVSDANNKFLDDPAKFTYGLLNLGIQSLAMQLRAGYAETGAAVGASVLTGGAATIPAMSLAAGLGSFKVEYMNSVLDYMREQGVDLTNQEAVADAFNNEEILDGARGFALKRGVPIAIFDALSGAVGGQILARSGRVLGKGVAARTAGAVGEVMTQMGLGGAGEFTGQLVSGQRNDVDNLAQLNREIFLEAAGEIVGGAPEVATAGIKAKIEQNKEKREQDKLAKQNEIPTEAEQGQETQESVPQAEEVDQGPIEAKEPQEGETVELPSLYDENRKFEYVFKDGKWNFKDSKGKIQEETGKKALSRIKAARDEQAQAQAKLEGDQVSTQESGQESGKKPFVMTPENSANYANMTEDNEGNFVFYHSGKKGYKQVEPRSGDNKATSRQEAGALSKVGGMAMFYTDKRNDEFSGSEAKYMVKVPKEKVYDANVDPNNYVEKARQRHAEEHPGKAFDANTQIAYITKIAGENGYEMTVSRWGKNLTRAQSTNPQAIADISERRGSDVVKPFQEDFESNRAQFEPQDAVSQRDNIEPVLKKIERALFGNYSSPLYNIVADPKLETVEEITEAVNNSEDLSQELKDEYNEALNKEETPQFSRRKETTEEGSKQEIEPKSVPQEEVGQTDQATEGVNEGVKPPPTDPPKESKKVEDKNPVAKRYPRKKLEESTFISDEAKKALKEFDDGGYEPVNVKPLHQLAKDAVSAMTMDEVRGVIPALKRGESVFENAIVADEFALQASLRAYINGDLKLFSELQSLYEKGVKRDLNSTQAAQRMAARGLSQTARLMDMVNNLTKSEVASAYNTEEATNSINESIKIEVEELKKIVADLQKKLAKEVKKAQEAGNIDKSAYKKIADKIRSQKIDPNELAFSAVIPPQLINAAIEIIAKTVEAAGSLAAGVSKAMSMLRTSDWHASMTEEEKRRFEKTIPAKLEKLAERVLGEKEKTAVQTSAKMMSKALEDLGLEFSDIVKKHYQERDKTYKTLEEKLIENLGLPPELAAKKAKEVANLFQDKVERAVNREVDRFIEKQEKKGVETEYSKKQIKGAKNQLLRIFETGRLLTDEDVKSAFSKAVGGHSISQDEMKLLHEMTYAISQMPDGLRKKRKIIEFNNKMSDLEGTSALMAIRSWYYASMLSGVFTTTLRASFGFLASTTVANIKSFFASPRAYIMTMPYLFKGMSAGNMADVFMTGYSDLDYFGRDPSQINEPQDIIQRNVNELIRRVAASMGKDLGIAKKELTYGGAAFAAFAAPVILASRAILLIDALITPGQAEHEAAMLAFYGARKSGNKDLMNSVQKQLGYNQDEKFLSQIEEEMAEMKRDGESIIGYKKRRLQELRQLQRDGDLQDVAMERAKTAALLNTPYGLVGTGIAKAQSWVNTPANSKEEAIFKGLILTTFPFMRVAANFIINNIEYLPAIGILPSIGSKRIQMVDGKAKLMPKNPLEKRRQWAAQMVGTSVATALITSLFDYDEEEDKYQNVDNPWLDVTYQGPGTWDNSDWISADLTTKDYEQLTFRIKMPNGKYSRRWSYREWPGLGNILASIGYMQDYHKYLSPEKIKEDNFDAIDWGSKMLFNMIDFSTEQSFAQGLNSLMALGQYVLPGGVEELERRRASREMEKMIARPINTILTPNLYKQSYRLEKIFFEKPNRPSMGDITYYSSNFMTNVMGRVSKDVPFLESFYMSKINEEVKTDHFGYPVVTPIEIPYLMDRDAEWGMYNFWRRRDYPERELLWNFDKVTLGWPWAEREKEYRGVKLTDDMKDAIEARQKLIFRNKVSDNLDDLYDLGEEDQFKLQERLNKYSRSAGRAARREWYEETQE